jgi:8-hydroxy-5-deazaflavin:NADPH oxidoreductase
VFGDDKEARGVATEIVGLTGLRGIQAGSLANSAAAEAMTSLLIFINKNYQVDGAGVVITGKLAF